MLRFKGESSQASSVNVAAFTISEVCDLVMSLGLDPRPFKENAVEGSDLLELKDGEFEEYLGLKPLQIKKIKKKLSELGAEAPSPRASAHHQSHDDDEDETPSKGIFQKYQEQVQQSSSVLASTHSAGGFQEEAAPRFASRDHREGGQMEERPPIDYSTMKPCERGLQEGVHAEEGQEEAERNLDVEAKIFSGANTGIDFDKYSSIPAEATGRDVPKPIDSFDKAEFHHLLAQNILSAKYKSPTPVQKYGIGIILAGRDLMACAQTGSGKTAAFLFPVISVLLKRGSTRADLINQELGGARRRIYPDATILCPTRELACQIFDEANKFTYRSYVKPCVVYGGADPKGQVQQIMRGCHILVATPGRLNQMIERGHISLSKTLYFIMDEADRMLDMGFEPQIRQIVEQHDLPKVGQRQTLMFSATFPREVQTLASEFLSDYVFLTVGRVGSASSTIQQVVDYVEENDKHDNLMKQLNTHKNGLTLVFVQTKKEADTLEEFVKRNGFPATSLNGDRMQWEREDSLESFRSGRTPVMVATDVAQRGLDIPNVNHVINFDMPANIDDYVHRIGRTGRVGNHGVATSFFNDQDTTLAADLVTILRESGQPVPTWLESCANEISGARVRTRYKFGGRDVRPGGNDYQGGGGRGGNGGSNFSSGGGGFDSVPAAAASGGDDLW